MKILRSPATLLLFVLAIMLGAYGASATGAGGFGTSMGMPDGPKHMGGSGDWLSIGSTFHYGTPYFNFYSGYYPYHFSYTNYYPIYTNYYSYSYPYSYSYFSYYPYNFYPSFHYSFTSSSYFSSHS